MKYIMVYLIIINAIGFLLMLIDKKKARRKAWRIPESVLLGAAIIGGSFGAYMGMEIFRHKTRHPKFTIGIPVIMIAQVLLAVLIRSI